MRLVLPPQRQRHTCPPHACPALPCPAAACRRPQPARNNEGHGWVLGKGYGAATGMQCRGRAGGGQGTRSAVGNAMSTLNCRLVPNPGAPPPFVFALPQ